MNNILRVAVAAAIGLVGSLTLMNLAGAQEATGTPSTAAPATEAPFDPSNGDVRDRDHPEKTASGDQSVSTANAGTSV